VQKQSGGKTENRNQNGLFHFAAPLRLNAAADNARIPQTAQVQCRRGYANRFRDLGI